MVGTSMTVKYQKRKLYLCLQPKLLLGNQIAHATKDNLFLSILPETHQQDKNPEPSSATNST